MQMKATSRIRTGSRPRLGTKIHAAGLGLRLVLMRPLLLGSLLTAIATPAAPAAVSAYQGAWVLSGRDCAEVFSAAGRGLSFRKPVDLFAPAFIVSGQRIQTPMASCRVRSIRAVGGRDHLDLDCANAVAANDVRVILAPGTDGTLTRYYSDQDPTGIAYRRCPARQDRTSARWRSSGQFHIGDDVREVKFEAAHGLPVVAGDRDRNGRPTGMRPADQGLGLQGHPALGHGAQDRACRSGRDPDLVHSVEGHGLIDAVLGPVAWRIRLSAERTSRDSV